MVTAAELRTGRDGFGLFEGPKDLLLALLGDHSMTSWRPPSAAAA